MMYTTKEAIKKIKKLWKNHSYAIRGTDDAVAIEEMLVILRYTDDEA